MQSSVLYSPWTILYTLIKIAKKLSWLDLKLNKLKLNQHRYSLIKILLWLGKFFFLNCYNSTKKLFWQDTYFCIINYKNQKLIHHIHCFGYIFCNQNKTMRFCWFCKFLFYDLYLELYWLKQTMVHRSNVYCSRIYPKWS